MGTWARYSDVAGTRSEVKQAQAYTTYVFKGSFGGDLPKLPLLYEPPGATAVGRSV